MRINLSKTLIALAAAAMITACSAPRNFQDLNKVEGVSMVYTSSALLKLTGGIASKVTGFNLGNVSKNVESVRLIIAENPSASKKAQDVVEYQLKRMHAVPLFETVGSQKQLNHSGIFVTQSSPNTYNNVVIVNDGMGKYQAIFLEGNISIEDINALKLE